MNTKININADNFKLRMKFLSSTLLILGLIFEIWELVNIIRSGTGIAFGIGSFVFHFLLIGFLLYGLLSKKDKIAEVGLTILKIFDGIFYPIFSFLKIDKINWSNGFENARVITYAISSFVLFIALIFFVLEMIHKKKIYFNLVLIFLLIASILMFSHFIVVVHDNIVHNYEWITALESISLCFTFLGMFASTLALGYEEEATISK